MTDTVAILNTIRATFADSEPSKFHIGLWFDFDTGCGCIIGQSLTMQPKIAEILRVNLTPADEEDSESGLRSIFGEPLWFGSQDAENSLEPQLGAAIGITADEVCYLFSCEAYPAAVWLGSEGHAEALRRLDEVIARYSTPITTPIERVIA